MKGSFAKQKNNSPVFLLTFFDNNMDMATTPAVVPIAVNTNRQANNRQHL